MDFYTLWAGLFIGGFLSFNIVRRKRPNPFDIEDADVIQIQHQNAVEEYLRTILALLGAIIGLLVAAFIQI